MKIKKITEVELDNFNIEIVLSVNSDEVVSDNIKFTYTCPECAGYGCMANKQVCCNGKISQKLIPNELIIDEKISAQIIAKLSNLINLIKQH